MGVVEYVCRAQLNGTAAECVERDVVEACLDDERGRRGLDGILSWIISLAFVLIV